MFEIKVVLTAQDLVFNMYPFHMPNGLGLGYHLITAVDSYF